MRLVSLLAVALLAACSSTTPPTGTSIDDDAAVDDGATAETGGSSAGADTTVTAFTKEEVSFTGMVNKRTVDKDATFPDSGSYEKITLHFTLECPSGKCDI